MAHRIPVSTDDSQDPLSRMRVFQLAGELIPDCFGDAKLVRAEPITEEIAGQLYAAVCSIEANISEAYSRNHLGSAIKGGLRMCAERLSPRSSLNRRS
jgi:hypothetical protein